MHKDKPGCYSRLRRSMATEPWCRSPRQPRQGERTEKIKYTIQNSYRIHYNLKGLLRGNSCHKGENLYII